jgi:hypothetical protein
VQQRYRRLVRLSLREFCEKRNGLYPRLPISRTFLPFFEEFQSIQTELVRFVLNKEVKHLPSHTRLFAFYSIGDRSRSSGVSGMMQGVGTESFTGFVFSEITFPPFGFVLSFNFYAPGRSTYRHHAFCGRILLQRRASCVDSIASTADLYVLPWRLSQQGYRT